MLNIFRDRLFYDTKLNRLATRHRSDKTSGYLTEFRYTHGYSRIYEQLFASPLSSELNLVEIGLLRPDSSNKQQSGDVISSAPSLRIWREYFPQAKLYGFDIRAYSGKPIQNCQIIRGDQGQRRDLARPIDACPGGFDIVIDDGSHASQHQQTRFAVLFPHKRPGAH